MHHHAAEACRGGWLIASPGFSGKIWDLPKDVLLQRDFCCSVVVSFSLSEESYAVSEGPNAMMPVRVMKDQNVLLANAVTLRVTPLTVQEALDRMVITDYPPDDIFSPERASMTS